MLALAGGRPVLSRLRTHCELEATLDAFMNTPTMDLPSPDGSVAADPQGFDRAAFLDRMAQESVTFFGKNLR